LGIVGTHPAVFVRVANAGVRGYGRWKNIRKMEDGIATEALRHGVVRNV